MALVGARGASEYFSRSVKGNNGSLSVAPNITGAVDSKTFSLVTAVNLTATGNKHLITFYDDPVTKTFLLIRRQDTRVSLVGYNPAGSLILDWNTTLLPSSVNSWGILNICIDMADSSNCLVFLDGVSQGGVKNITDDFLSLSTNIGGVGIMGRLGDLMVDTELSHFYFTTDYIDFSLESNRLLFVDGLGYPVPLQPSIDAGLIPEGLIRMGFEDASNLGFNSGTGGDFLVNGTVTSGSDVSV